MVGRSLDTIALKVARTQNNPTLLVHKFSVLMFLILLNTNLLRSLKDSVVPLKLGTELLSFIRIYLELPLLCLWVCIYKFWIERASQVMIFRDVVGFYLILIVWFSIHSAGDNVQLQTVQLSLTKFEATIHYWQYSLFYVLCDLWPVIAYINFYWELSNRLFSVEAARKAYPQYHLVGQSNLFISGILIILSTFLDSTTVWGWSLESKSLIVMLSCLNFILIEGLYTNLSKYTPTYSSNLSPKRFHCAG